MSNEITRYEEGENISLAQSPERVLSEAKRAADALISVISQKKKPVKFGGETYLEFEDWQTVAKFYGCTVKVTKSEFVNYGDVKGFDATAIVIDRLGNEISSAESMCLNDEENWGNVPKYEWKDELDANGKKQWVPAKGDKKGYFKGSRIQVGTEPKPLFQLKSMAQTRACAKALRNVFSWVVVLAGFKPNVAEELSDSQFANGSEGAPDTGKAAPQIQRKSEKANPLPPVGAAAPAKTAAATEPVICSECRIEDGHAPSCPYNPDNKNKATDTPANDQADHGDAWEGPEPVASKTEDKPQLTKEEKNAAREKAWVEFAGHDPKKHINYKQANLLFVVQSKMGISEEQMKDYMLKHLKVEHRPHIPKEVFTPLLDALDPKGEHHKLGGQ